MIDENIVCIEDINQDNILSSEVVTWIFSIENEIERECVIQKLTEMADELKKKTAFNKILQAGRREFAKFQRERAKEYGNQLEKGGETQFDGTYMNLNCGEWVADENGVFAYSANGVVRACNHPVTIVSFYENIQNGAEKVRIAFKKNGRWKEITPKKSVVSSANKIVALSDSGLNVTSETAKNLVKYISDLERLNSGVIQVSISTTKFGWLNVDGKDLFIPYDLGKITFDGVEQFENVFNSIRSEGNYDMWMSMVKYIRSTKRIEPRIMLAASFASAIVDICGVLPFFVHLHGKTEGGKTVCLMLAASVWADPKRGSGFMGDFLTTPTAIESRAGLLNHLPMIMDDSSKVSKRISDDFSELIYMLTNGTGKDRSNEEIGLRMTSNWSNCILTSGEHPIIRENDQGGAANRVIEITCGYDAIFSDGHFVAECLKSNFGFAGKEFVEAIKEIGFSAVRQIQRDFSAELMKSENTQKQALAMSVILAADKIATDHIFKDGMALTDKDVAEYLKTAEMVSEDVRCLNYLYETIAVNHQRFLMESYPEVWGFFKTEDSHQYAVIIKKVFDDLLKKEGYSPKSFLRWAECHGVIQTDIGRTTKVCRLPNYPQTIRCVVLRMDYVNNGKND